MFCGLMAEILCIIYIIATMGRRTEDETEEDEEQLIEEQEQLIEEDSIQDEDKTNDEHKTGIDTYKH